MKDEDEVQKLIRLKRYETPGEQYYRRFAEDFKDRQRAELLQRSSRALFAERFSLWFDEVNGTKWLVPAGAAAAVVAAGVFLSPAEQNEADPGVATVASRQAAEEPTGTPAFGDEDFQVDIPRPAASMPDVSIPGFGPAPSGDAADIVPASVRGNLREL
ncbi:MAG: hypothetical protein WD342_11865 [Verrucomicrobiales bacterium]